MRSVLFFEFFSFFLHCLAPKYYWHFKNPLYTHCRMSMAIVIINGCNQPIMKPLALHLTSSQHSNGSSALPSCMCWVYQPRGTFSFLLNKLQISGIFPPDSDPFAIINTFNLNPLYMMRTRSRTNWCRKKMQHEWCERDRE